MDSIFSINPFWLIASSLILYQILRYVYDHFISATPEITPNILTFLLDRSKTAHSVVNEAYYKYSKTGKIFRFYGFYVTPVSTFPEYRKLGKSVLSLSNAIDDAIYLKYFLGDDNTDVVEFVIKDVTRKIPLLLPGIHEEVKRFWKESFPPPDASGGKWFEQVVQPKILRGIGRIACRFLAGKRYSANTFFVENASEFANGIQQQAIVFRYLPSSLLPFFCKMSPIMTRVNNLKNLVRDDLYAYIENPVQDDLDRDEEPVILRYLVKYVQNHHDYRGAHPDKILAGTVGRFLGLMFAAIDTTTLTTTQALFDLLSSSREEYIVPIQNQISETLGKHNGVWNQQALTELSLLDSFIKESQRLHPMSVMLGTRKVMKAGGHTFNPTGDEASNQKLHVPEGSIVMMPLYGVHSDPSNYPEPYSFKGFRYLKDPDRDSRPSDQFLSFGHGRHVCPGRHLALCVVKLMVIEFFASYDWKQLERPKDIEFGPTISPNHRQKMTVRSTLSTIG